MENMTLEELVDDIAECVNVEMSEAGVADADRDEFEEGYFLREVRRRIANLCPGWEILYTEYGDC